MPGSSRVLIFALFLTACGDDPSAEGVDADGGSATARARSAGRAGAAGRAADAPAPATPLAKYDTARREKALDADLAGRPARAWIALARGDEEPADGLGEDAARAALRNGGAAAADAMIASLAEDPLQGWAMLRGVVQDLRDALVPGLVALLSHDDPAVREAARRELDRMAAIGGFGPHDALVATALARDGIDASDAAILGTLGPAAAATVGDLAAMLKDEERSSAAIEALRGLGADATEASAALAAFVEAGLATREPDPAHTDDGVPPRQWPAGAAGTGTALETLRRIGPRAAPASADRLADLLRRERDFDAVQELVRTLDALGEGAKAAAALLPRLTARDVADRVAAAYGLGFLDAPGAQVAAALSAAVRDPGEDVARLAAGALHNAAVRDDACLAAMIRLAAERSGLGDVGQSILYDLATSVWDGGMLDPPLLRALASSDTALRVLAIRLVPDCPLYPPYDGWAWWYVREAAKSDVAAVRRAAEDVLRPAEGAAPPETSAQSWATRLATPDVAEREQALAELLASKDDVGAVAALVVSWLRSENRSTRLAACWGIAALGPRAAAGLDPLVAILTDGKTEDWMLRYAGEAAGSIGAAALPALCDVVRKRGDLPELDRAFARLGEDAVPAVLARLSDSDADVRTALVRCLRALGGDAVVVVPRVEGMLEDPKDRVRVAASGTLLALGSRVDRAVERLAEVLSGELHPDDLVQRDAALELAQAGAAAKPALPVLVRALRSSVSCDTWAACARAVAGIGPAAAEAVPALVAGLRGRVVCGADRCRHGEVARIPIAAAESLGALGPAAASAIPSLEAAARDDDRTLRRAAAAALAKLR